MRSIAVALAALLLTAAGFTLAGAWPAAASGASAGNRSSGNGSGGCDPYIDGTVVPVPCSSGGGRGGGGGGGAGGSTGGGSAVNNTCTFVPLNEAQARNLGLSWPPPKGRHWALMDCVGGAPGSGPEAVLITNATGAPQVTPQQLLVQALRELTVPHLQPATAPPRGTDGLVGLPEWFWVPSAEWHARSVTVTAGPVWATAVAAPIGLALQPGPGLSPVSCAGAGTAYNARKPSAQQHTGCSYTYQRPSAGQPENVYHASLTVTWRVSWTGSGGSGGVLDAALGVPVGVTIPVAQGEALVTSP
jgi:hypothetical protein